MPCELTQRRDLLVWCLHYRVGWTVLVLRQFEYIHGAQQVPRLAVEAVRCRRHFFYQRNVSMTLLHRVS